MTASPGPPIVVATPTVMDGLVLCWYRDTEAWNVADEMCSASRNRVEKDEGCPDAWVIDAVAAQRLLGDGRTGEARAMATHEPTRLFGGELRPIHPPAESTQESAG